MMSTREKHPKIHRIALVDNDPRALDSLSAVIACKVPTAYVVWTATSGDEAIERCQDANSNVSLLILDMSMGGLQGPATCRRLRLMGKHMQSILRKLNCKTSRQAVALWVRSNAF